jgi:hypothetical protein
MTRMHSYTKRASISSADYDLTVIKGIGPTIAARLREAGVLSLAQLADLTPEDITKRVAGLSTKRITREKWIKQAQKWALKTTSIISPKNETRSAYRLHYATFTVEFLLGEDNRVRRTRVSYVQNNLVDSWAGWTESKLVDFINKSAGICLPQHDNYLLPTRNHDVTCIECIPDTKIRNTLGGVLRIFELITTPIDSDLPQLLVHKNEAFNIHILLDLSEIKTPQSMSLNCIVKIWARRLGTGARQIIGELISTIMPDDKIPCVVESKIPVQGTYRLEVLASLTAASSPVSPQTTLSAWQESGPLQVV